MSAKAHLQKYWEEDPVAKRLKRGNVAWGNYLVDRRSPGAPPPLPPTAPKDARMVWNPQLQKYVVGLKRFNYVPDVGIWLNRQKAMRARQRSRSPSRSTRRVTRYYNEKTKTYKPASRSPSRSTRRRGTRYYNEKTKTYRSLSRSPSTRRKHRD